MIEIIVVCGARPNYMKVAPLMRAFRECGNIHTLLVHTGQHYDDNMNDVFFQQLGLPRPDINLAIGSASHGAQTAQVMQKFEQVLIDNPARAVLVVGDVNSTLACALTAETRQLPVLHVEAGLRSFDRTMPEEINRVLTDAVSDMLFVSEPSGEVNLQREGIDPEGVHFVGNVMIDTLRRHLERARESGILERLSLEPGGYGLITLHRPANVDDPGVLGSIVRALKNIQQQLPLVFCMHPRTRRQAAACGALEDLQALPAVLLTPPLGYLEFLHLTAEAVVVLTDSGGLQEETTILRVPCLTLRDNTERPITVTHGTNRLVGSGERSIIDGFRNLDHIRNRATVTPPLWDGRASLRIAEAICERF